MTNNVTARRIPSSLGWTSAFFGAGGAAGLWYWLAQGDRLQMALAVAGLALAAVLGIVWQVRARSASRFQAALDAFAEREIARAPHGTGPKR
jgi:hypothetical protein